MTEHQKYSSTSEHGADTSLILVIIFFSIVYSTLFILDFKMHLAIRFMKLTSIISEKIASLFLSSGYALFLPLMSFMFSRAKQYNQEGRAQDILILMVFIEFIRILCDPISAWRLRKSAEKLVGLFWVGFLVASYAPLKDIRGVLLLFCICCAFFEIEKGIIFNIATHSYLIGKNPKLIHNYVKRIMHDGGLQTTPMNSCDYIVWGEENQEIKVSSNGYNLGNTESVLTIGSVFQLDLVQDGEFTSAYPNWRDTCISLALAKMLRRRFAKLPVDEARCKKALDFVLQELIGSIGRNKDIPTYLNYRDENPMERVFSIIQEELKFVSDFLHMEVPNCHYFPYGTFSLAMVFGQLYLVKKGAMGLFLMFAGFLIEWFRYRSFITKRWIILTLFNSNIEKSARWKKFYSSLADIKLEPLLSTLPISLRNMFHGQEKNTKEARVYSTVFDVSILACLPKCIRKKIQRLFPTLVHSTDAKQAILMTLSNSGGQLTNGEVSLKKHGIEHLNWACQNNNSSTEAILVWHIATTLLDHQERSSQQNNDPHQKPESQKRINPFKRDREVALALSNYCLYLVAYLPELLSDDWTEEMYESVRKEILAIPQSSCPKHTKTDLCSYALQAMWVENSIVGKGAMLAKDLMKCAEDGKLVWEMLAEFWAEFMLFISPSNNVEAHEKILEKGELITQLWALLTHAGIITRPNVHECKKNNNTHAVILTWPRPTWHHDHESNKSKNNHGDIL